MTGAVNSVSVLYREPKLLKAPAAFRRRTAHMTVSVLYREPKLLKVSHHNLLLDNQPKVSVLYREPKLLKFAPLSHQSADRQVSVLYREPKLLKELMTATGAAIPNCFSALP